MITLQQRIATFLDASAITTLEDAQADLLEWGYTDVTGNPEHNPDAAFRVYRDNENNVYICADAQSVVDFANGDEDYTCVTPDCTTHCDEPGGLCLGCTKWLEESEPMDVLDVLARH